MQIYEEAFTHPYRAKKDDRVVLILNPKEAKQLYEMSRAMTKAFPRRQLWKTWHKTFTKTYLFNWSPDHRRYYFEQINLSHA